MQIVAHDPLAAAPQWTMPRHGSGRQKLWWAWIPPPAENAPSWAREIHPYYWDTAMVNFGLNSMKFQWFEMEPVTAVLQDSIEVARNLAQGDRQSELMAEYLRCVPWDFGTMLESVPPEDEAAVAGPSGSSC